MRWFPHADNENVLVLATGLGIYLILFGIMWLRSGVKEHRWPAAEGKIVSSKVESFKTFSGGRGSNATPVTIYGAAVVYAYEIDGRHYHSGRIRREKISGSEPLAQSTVAKYPQGSSVRVHYNPSNPADAVVETSALFGVIVLWGMALLMFAVAASVSGYFHRE